MKISVTKAAPDVYVLTIDETEVALDGSALKTLLVEVTRVLAPTADIAATDEDRARNFARRIKNANDMGIQKLLLVCDHDDLLVLLKLGEQDKALLRKFYGNMSDRLRKIFAEDLAFKFKDGVPRGRIRDAVDRLSRTARDLEGEGTLVYENVVSR